MDVRYLAACPARYAAARVRAKTAAPFGEPALLACALARARVRRGHDSRPETPRVLRQLHMHREFGNGQNRARVGARLTGVAATSPDSERPHGIEGLLRKVPDAHPLPGHVDLVTDRSVLENQDRAQAGLRRTAMVRS